PVRAPVEPLEEDGAGRDRSGGREAERADPVSELARRVGWIGLPRRERALELDDAEAVALASEVLREEPVRLRPVRGELTGRGEAYPDPAAELDLRADGDADERR